jgi:hypothetical protein
LVKAVLASAGRCRRSGPTLEFGIILGGGGAGNEAGCRNGGTSGWAPCRADPPTDSVSRRLMLVKTNQNTTSSTVTTNATAPRRIQFITQLLPLSALRQAGSPRAQRSLNPAWRARLPQLAARYRAAPSWRMELP